MNVKQVSWELGVQYLLEGSVRKAGNRLRVTAQLIDALTDRHVWAERYDRELTDVFAIQDEMTESIAMAVAPEVQVAEMERARRKLAPELGTWEMVARAISHNARFSKEDSAEAERLLVGATEQDRANPRCYSTLAYTYATDGFYGWHRPPAESFAMAAEMANRALDLDNRDAEGHAVLGLVFFFSKRHDDAIRALETAIDLNPNSSSAIGSLGITLVYTGAHVRANELLHRAIRLSPSDPYRFWHIVHLAMIEFMAERYEKALPWTKRAVDENPAVRTGYRALAACYGMLGNEELGRANVEKLTSLVPGVTISATLRAMPFAREEDADRYAEGLRRAGMPE